MWMAVAFCGPEETRGATLTIYDSGGFESPRFVESQNLQGQDAPPGGEGPWRKDSGVSSALVQADVVSGGLQGVRVSRVANANGDTRWAVLKPVTPIPSQEVITIDFDMRVEQATGLSFGPAFGIECYDGSVGSPKLIGSLTVDATTGDVLYAAAGSGVLRESGTVIPLGVFRQYTLSADFTARTYSTFLDGALLHTEPFVDNTAVRFTDAPLVTFAATPDSIATATGTAYYDNYVLKTVPEPGLMPLLAPAAFALFRRRPAIHSGSSLSHVGRLSASFSV
jgi:hypothetical protein